MSCLHAEKARQASALMRDSDLDVWMIFIRESASSGDGVLPLILEGSLTWQSALIFGCEGQRIAIVGNYDADPILASGNWEVRPYVQSIREALTRTIKELAPRSSPIKIGLNYSTNDDKADGLSHGMFLLLQEYLREEKVVFVSAEHLAMSLRGRKTEEEVCRMRAAIVETDKLFREIETFVSTGKRSEKQVFDHVQSLILGRRLGFAWDEAGDPLVNSGPDSMIGHGIPSETILLEEGHVFHIDLGVTVDGYSSDLQRCWYVGDSVPEDVQRGLDAVNRAISAGAAALVPGVQGWQVDDAARASLVGDGYVEYMHALGHQVGQLAHDGGTILGPRWERYGNTPYQQVQEGEVYTLELGVILPGRGYLGLEEMVRVTATGLEWLSDRQLTMPTIPAF